MQAAAERQLVPHGARRPPGAQEAVPELALAQVVLATRAVEVAALARGVAAVVVVRRPLDSSRPGRTPFSSIGDPAPRLPRWARLNGFRSYRSSGRARGSRCGLIAVHCPFAIGEVA
jgi:hypothetical protein